MKPGSQIRLSRNVWAAIIFSSFIFLFCLLVQLRYIDNSRLTSWNDVFGFVNPLRTGVLLCIGLIAAFIASRNRLFERNPPALLFLLSFAVSALFWQEPEMIVDASRYFTQAKHLELYGAGYFLREWGSGINAWTDLPAVPFLYGVIFWAFGESRLTIQILNTLLYSSAVMLTYMIGRDLWGRDTGFYAAIFLLGIPYLFTQVPLMLVDLPSMFFLMLSVYTFLYALRRGRIMVPIAGVVIFITFFTKYSAWLMLTVIPVIYAVVLYQNRQDRPGVFGLRGMIALSVSILLIMLLFVFKYDVIMRQIQLLMSYQMPGLKRWGESLVSIYFFQMHPVIAVLAAVSVFTAFKNRDGKLISAAWPVFVVLALQVMRIRYIIMVFPFLSLMAAYGLNAIRDRMTAGFIAYSTAAVSMALAISGFLPFLQNTSAVNLRDAGRFLDSIDAAVVEVVTPLPQDYVMNPAVSVPVLDLYTNRKMVYRYDYADYPMPEDAETSALRFTWTYINPLYYQDDIEKNNKKAVVVISDSSDRELPQSIHRKIADLSQKRVFEVNDDIFRHKTLVTIYH